MLMEQLCNLSTNKWTDYPTDRPGNRPGIQGKLLVKHVQVVKQVFFPSPFFLWWMHSFSYVRGFPMRFFTRLRVLTRHPRILGFQCFSFLLCCCLLLYWRFPFLFLSGIPLHLPYEGKCQNNGRPEMTDRRRRPEMTDRRRHVRR